MCKTKLKTVTVFIISLLSIGWIDPASERNEEGINLYNEEKLDEAIGKFTDAQSLVPESDQLQFNIANTHFKKGKFPEAEKSYLDVIKSDDVILKAKGNYNMGNTLYKQGKLKESLDFYKQAIGVSEEHQHLHDEELDALREDAKYNYEFVEKKIEEMQKEQKEREEQEEKEEKEDQEQKQDQKDEDKEENRDKQEQEQKQDEAEEEEKEQQQQQQNREEEQEKREGEQKSEPKPSEEEKKDPPPASQPQEKREMKKEEAERILDAMKQAEKSARDLQEKEKKSATYGILKDW
ncbi:MAG: hypothetical protein D8M57_12010 [Candidatus Scalindua sp. AMX11]|nr:MAG: hypothetical protein DWQ00_01920 [Candidatus Scalindua sp.]NOG85465.1 tetratricopeptide repeat protein [Planctomycetota bacterium]RZV90283.1 MAG: tetratricopeptide repeat protein [Candidatus Scalindua sp. SCAELEC01]TDE64693.1 MAG: hypothetical protein D8M57_12010 [Candidatus Scalindua sp. AMX11]GJQ60802.1 MAG: hypothetical protein SCALA701_36030 [Candidatus Scalindua sp.]